MKNKKKVLFGVLSFLIPLFILLVVFYFSGSFGDKNFIIGDSQAQYYPLFSYFKGFLNGTNSIFYSFHKNIGGTMFGTFFYYLSSPLNLLLYFFDDVVSFIEVITILKISLSGLFMYIYMVNHHGKCNFLILVFSICYALMGYNMNYFVNVMWLDVVMLSPIVILGIDRIIDGKSPLLYVIFLVLSIFSNYYISYMLCLFCVLYFFFNLSLKNLERVDKIKLIKRFFIVSLLSGLMCSFFLIPCFIESRTYMRSLNFKNLFNYDINLFDIFSKTYIGSMTSADVLCYSSFNIYCGTVILLLVFLYFFNHSIDFKKRKLFLILIGLMIIPRFISIFNYAWHLFTIPSFYSFRYSFLLTFVFINIAYESYEKLEFRKKYILYFLAIYSVVCLYLVIITFIVKGFYPSLSYKSIWLTLAFLFVYIFLLSKKNKHGFSFIMCLLLVIELSFNCFHSFKSYLFNTITRDKTSQYGSLVDKYRGFKIGFESGYTLNDSLLFGYNSPGVFLSTNNNLMSFYMKMNYKREYKGENLYAYLSGQYLYDYIIGLDYVISSSDLYYDVLDKVSVNEINYNVYKTNYNMGFAYMVKDSCNNIDYSFDYDQKVFNCLFSKDKKYYREYDIVKKDDSYTINLGKHNELYLCADTIDSFNPNFESDFLVLSHSCLYFPSIDTSTFKFDLEKDFNIEQVKAMYFDYDKFLSDVSRYKIETLDYTIMNNELIGSIDTDGGLLMVTLPYEKGFSITVDGVSSEYEKVLDSFIGIRLSAGHHDIKVKYKQPCFKIGCLVSLFSLIVCCLYFYLFYNRCCVKNVKKYLL